MALSGHTTVTTVGTEVVLGTQYVNGPLLIKALPGNTGIMYIGNDGSGAVSSATGFPLGASDVTLFDLIHSLGEILVDASVAGEGVAWLTLTGEQLIEKRMTWKP
jgi:hypothetical protein